MSAEGSYVLVADAETALERQVRAETDAAIEVVGVRDGLAAHEVLAKRGPPLALFADLALPRRDGFALVRGLRRVDVDRRVPAVVVTRFPPMLQAAREAGDLGPVLPFLKPLPAGVAGRAVRDGIAAQKKAATAPPPAMTPRAATAPPPAMTPRTATAPPPAMTPRAATAPPPAAMTPRAASIQPAVVAAPVLPAPPVERARMARIDEMCVVDDSPPDPELQSYMERIAKDFGVPIVIASVMLTGHQWYKAYSGLTGKLLADRASPREWTFCQHVIQAAAPLVVPDARHHPLFAHHPMVEKGVLVGYAGVPLIAPSGEAYGTLCLVDQRPLDIGPDELQRLVMTARSVAGEIELRAIQKRTVRPPIDPTVAEHAFPYFEATLQGLDVGVILLREDHRAVLANRAVGHLFGIDQRTLHGKTRDAIVDLLSAAFARPAEELAKLRVATARPWVIREEIELALPEQRVVRWVGRPVPLTSGIGHLISITDITSDIPTIVLGT